VRGTDASERPELGFDCIATVLCRFAGDSATATDFFGLAENPVGMTYL